MNNYRDGFMDVKVVDTRQATDREDRVTYTAYDTEL